MVLVVVFGLAYVHIESKASVWCSEQGWGEDEMSSGGLKACMYAEKEG